MTTPTNKLDFNNFRIKGFPPDYVWESYAYLTYYRLGAQGGSLKHLDLAWDELKRLGCHYVDRKKIMKNIIRFSWGHAHFIINSKLADLEYSPRTTCGSPDKVTLYFAEQSVDVPFKKWTRGLKGNDLSEDTYFEVIVLDPQVLIPILREQDVYNHKSFAGSEYVLLTIIDDAN